MSPTVAIIHPEHTNAAKDSRKEKILKTICFFSYSHGTHHCGKRFIKIPFSPLLFLQQHVFIHPEHTTATKDSKKKYLVKTFFLKTKCLHSPGIHHCGKRFKEKYKKIFLKKDPVISLLSHFLPGNKDLFCLATRSFFGDKNLFVLDVCFCLVDNGHFQYSH